LTVVLFGAGGHGRAVLDVARRAGLKVLGFLDDAPLAPTFLGFPVLGGREVLAKLAHQAGTSVIVSIGDNRTRLAMAGHVVMQGLPLAAVTDPTAFLAPDAHLSPGSVLMPGSIVVTGSTIGQNVIINTAATVDHDCVVGDGVHVAPGVHLGGGVAVDSEVFIGIGATVAPGIRIGARSIIGAGTVVLRDVPAGVVMVGNPGRILRTLDEELIPR
jgi:sugar O-acyltransferase (sialic acid O-acetyltransferase NeuD family)